MADTSEPTPRRPQTPEERRRAHAEYSRKWRQEHPEQARASDKRYRERHRDQRAAARARWRESHPDEVRDSRNRWRAENLERSRQLNRESEHRRAERARPERERAAKQRAAERDRARRQKIQRKKAAERTKRWRKDNPERAKANQRRWRERNPDRLREYGRAYAQAHPEKIAERSARYRDKHPELNKERQKDWRARHPEYNREYLREYRRDPEKYAKMLEANRDAKRLRTRLQRLGLPAKSARRRPIAERRQNERDAAAFFGGENTLEWSRQYRYFHFALANAIVDHESTLRGVATAQAAARERAGLSPVDVDSLVYTRAAGMVIDTQPEFDQLTSADIARAVSSVRAIRAQRAKEQQREQLIDTVKRHVRQRVGILRREAEIENRARARVGKPALRLDVLVHYLAFEDVKDTIPLDLLVKEDVLKALNRAREAQPTLFEPTQYGTAVGPATAGLGR